MQIGHLSGEEFAVDRPKAVQVLVERQFEELHAEPVESLQPEVVRTLVKGRPLDLLTGGNTGTLNLRPDQLHLTVERYGNTGAASVPITLDDAVRAGRLFDDDVVLLVAFGGGMSWGGTAWRWIRPRKPGETW